MQEFMRSMVWVKREVMRSEEFGMPEIRKKRICVDTRTYVGTSFVGSKLSWNTWTCCEDEVEGCDMEQ